MEEKLKQMFAMNDEPHITQAKEMAKAIWENPSRHHAEMIDTIKSVLIKFHEGKIDSIKKS